MLPSRLRDGYTTNDYRQATGSRTGDDILVGWWLDKPHQVVAELCREIEERDLRIAFLEAEAFMKKMTGPNSVCQFLG